MRPGYVDLTRHLLTTIIETQQDTLRINKVPQDIEVGSVYNQCQQIETQQDTLMTDVDVGNVYKER